ncbi:oligoketide cyclase/lipid transport protein [Xenococcus sp. PCC 7305]|nr:oligoketide cyclase/lipid transport protein [Xenococcus sp. PCC 7305]
MSGILNKLKFNLFLGSCILAIAINISITSAHAKLFDGPVDQLPVLERVALREGKVIITGQKGEYVCRILVTSSIDTVWQVLTDYNNFELFLPGVTDSQLLEINGDRKVFEQFNRIKTLIFSTKARVRMAITESYPQKIAFNFLDGDLDTLDGTWLLEPVSPYPSAAPNQVLITHQVNVEPNAIPSRSFFYNIYENTLEKTLVAIKQEVEERWGIRDEG